MSASPALTVIVPTKGREHLATTLESIAGQPGAKAVEVLVVADTHGHRPELPRWDPAGRLANFEVLHHDAGFNCWGHPQRNYAQQRANGWFICSLDDDDTWEPLALPSILEKVEGFHSNLHVFKMRYAASGLELWMKPQAMLGNVGTPMMVYPNDPAKMGEWGEVYEGDYSFLVSVIANFGSEDCILWHDRVIARIAPRVFPR